MLSLASCGAVPEERLSSAPSAPASASAASDDEGEPPQRMLIEGVEVERAELGIFDLVQLAKGDPAQLVLLGGQNDPGKPNPCSLEAVARRLAEDDKGVRIGVYLYRTVEKLVPNQGCPSIAYPPQRLVVQLNKPLAGRGVVDASSERPVAVVDPARLLQLTELPDGYAKEGELTIDQLPSRGGLVTMWTYAGADRGVAIHLRQGAPEAVEPPDDAGLQELGRYTVHGRTAVFNQAPNFADVKCMRWRETDQLSAVLCTRGNPEAPLDADTMARLAEATATGG